MTDDSYNTQDKKSPARPVWSDKADGGYLEDFLAGGDDKEAASASDASHVSDAEKQGESAEDIASPQDLEARVTAALKQIYDPEIPVNIYDLGLIYAVEADADHNVRVTMTLTTPHCPVAESMPYEVESRVRSVDGVNDVDVALVWDPPWDMSLMSDEARLELGLL